MRNLNDQLGEVKTAYAAGTNSGATATVAAVTGKTHYITEATFWSDTDSLINLKQGTTVVWEGKITTAVGPTYTIRFNTPIASAVSALVSATVVSSTSDCGVSINAFTTG